MVSVREMWMATVAVIWFARGDGCKLPSIGGGSGGAGTPNFACIEMPAFPFSYTMWMVMTTAI
jgi:hypothetical protein